MKQIKFIASLLFLFLIITTTSCIKEVLPEETSCSCNELVTTSSAIKKQLTAHTWQIEEVIDPYMGVRYKRGIKNDGKDFGIARYQYHDNDTLTGTDWFGNALVNYCYTLLDKDRKLKVITPLCSSIQEIIIINATQFTYTSNDGSTLTLTPVNQTNNPSKN